MAANKWTQPTQPPPPLFVGQAERDFVKQINDEVIEKVVGQQVLYFPIDMEKSNYHRLYGEAIKKTFLPPVRAYALVEYAGSTRTQTEIGFDNVYNINVHFHKRRLQQIKTYLLGWAIFYSTISCFLRLLMFSSQDIFSVKTVILLTAPR